MEIADNYYNNPSSNEPTLRLYIPPPPSSNPNSSGCSEEEVTNDEYYNYVSKFKEVNSENLKTLCTALEKKVPWQKHVLPDIVSTILQCRSGMLRRNSSEAKKEDTWLFFQGADVEAKQKIGRELGRLIFGGGGSHSNNNLVSIASSSNSNNNCESKSKKRSRDDEEANISGRYIERLGDEVSRNPHRVFMVEDIEKADYGSQLGLKRAIEGGTLQDSNGNQVCLSDAIIILSSHSDTDTSSFMSPHDNMDHNAPQVLLSLDLNISTHHHHSVHGLGLLESVVDRRIFFKIHQL